MRTGTSGYTAFARYRGRLRAAFWRALGFPNLVLARAAKAAKRQRAQARAVEEQSRREAQKRANEIATNLDALRRR